MPCMSVAAGGGHKAGQGKGVGCALYVCHRSASIAKLVTGSHQAGCSPQCMLTSHCMPFLPAKVTALEPMSIIQQ